MEKKNLKKEIIMFGETQVRRIWDKEKEKWYFSVVDVVGVLANNDRPRKYWNDLKMKLKDEGSQLSDKIGQLKLLSNDGKYRLTDTADVETLLRLIQSIPSPKAEPFKLWLAKVGYERMRETVDPELAVTRARNNWQKRGLNEKWISQRMLNIQTRNKLTDYWSGHGIERPDEYARLTNIIHEEWSGLSVKKHKAAKGIEVENLRDHMSEAELIFTSLAELSTKQIAESDKAEGYGENKVAAKKGGKISGDARLNLEKQTGRKIIEEGKILEDDKTLGKA